MAMTEGVLLKHRNSNSRSSSQSSSEAEFGTCDVSNRRATSCQPPMSLSSIISTSYKHLPNLLIPDPEFLKLLKTVGAKSDRIVKDAEIYTVQQLCFYLKEYIKSRQLYDVNNVRTVYCGDDPLGKIFHVDQFTIHDVLKLISKASTPIVVEPSKNKSSGIVKRDGVLNSVEDIEDLRLGSVTRNAAELSPKKPTISVNHFHAGNKTEVKENETSCAVVTSSTDLIRKFGLKRSHEEELEQVQDKRLCLGKCSAEKDVAAIGETVGFETFSVTLDDDLTDAESVYSVQSKETALVKDSSDDLWFLKEDDGDSLDLSDIYADEYDVVSELSHESSSDADDYDSDVFVEVKDFVSFDGSETDFADGEQSDAEDEKLSQLYNGNNQMWKCLKCRHSNPSPARLCNECLNVRTEELFQAHFPSEHNLSVNSVDFDSSASRSDVEKIAGLSFDSNKQLTEIDSDHVRQLCTVTSDSHDESFAADLTPIFSSQESGFWSGEPENVANEGASTNLYTKGGASDCDRDALNQSILSSNVCIICLSEPKVASLIHGKSGHQACCYQCAWQLKKMRKPCPVCRRPIEKVIRNYVV